MTKFVDGPAAGVVLALQRSPQFLRAVQNDAGTWDALDQLGDDLQDSETVTVYRRIGKASRVHLYGSKISGWYAVANYALHPEQPAIEVARDTAKWRAWATAAAANARATS